MSALRRISHCRFVGMYSLKPKASRSLSKRGRSPQGTRGQTKIGHIADHAQSPQQSNQSTRGAAQVGSPPPPPNIRQGTRGNEAQSATPHMFLPRTMWKYPSIPQLAAARRGKTNKHHDRRNEAAGRKRGTTVVREGHHVRTEQL